RRDTRGVLTGTPAPTISVTLLLSFASQMLPEPSIARLSGSLMPLPVMKPDGGESGVPKVFNSVTLSLRTFTTQTSPEPSIAMPYGESKPPPVNPPEGEMGVPEESNLVTLPPPLPLPPQTVPQFATQILPEPSIASRPGRDTPPAWRPPPTKPLAEETGTPEGPNSVTLPFPRFATQRLPEPSKAIPSGRLRPPPVNPTGGESGRPEGSS